MSEFTSSPRPRIVNGVLIKECNDNNRRNGLQGTDSKEDFYRAIVAMPSPVPEGDIPLEESVSGACDAQLTPQENCPNLENVNRRAQFDHERSNITGHSKTCSAHCDHRQAFEPQECEQHIPSCCAHSNSRNYPTAEKLDTGKEGLDSRVCCEGKHSVHRNEWERGDHHRSMENDSTLNKEGCYNTPPLLNKDQPKYPYGESSSQSARRGSTLEECQDINHHHACPCTHDAVLTEGKPSPRTTNCRRLHDQGINRKHGSTENCNALTEAENSCNPQNAIRKPLSRGNSRTMQCKKSEDLTHSYTSSPDCLHTTPQGCRPQDEHNQATARQEEQDEEFPGYPPQRCTELEQCNMPTRDENVSRQGNQNTNALRNKQGCRRFIRKRFQAGNVTENEASSVAEILSHPVVDVDLEKPNTLAPPCSVPLRNVDSEILGYPPQPTRLRRSKYSAHRACENDSYNEETHCINNTQKSQVTGPHDYSKLNDSWTHAEGDHEQTCVGQRGNMRRGNEREGCNEYHRAYNTTNFRRPHRTENEREETSAHDSIQDAACVNQEQDKKNICAEHSPRTFHPEAQEQHSHCHHCSNMPDEEMKHFSGKKLLKEPKCHAPVSGEVQEETCLHRGDDILNEIYTRRKNKQLHGGSASSNRPICTCHEDESYRKENENIVHAAEGDCNEHPISSTVEHSDVCAKIDKNISRKDGHSVQPTAPRDELQAGERKKCFAQSANVPTREAEHVTDNPHPHVCKQNSKTTEGVDEFSAVPSCEVNKQDDNIVPCETDRLCSPDADSSDLNEQCIKKPYHRCNGLDDEDFEITNPRNIDVSFEDKDTVSPRKNRMPIEQDIPQDLTSKNETAAKLNPADAETEVSEEQNHLSNLTPKTRIAKLKSNMHLASKKSTVTVGYPQRPKRITNLKS